MFYLIVLLFMQTYPREINLSRCLIDNFCLNSIQSDYIAVSLSFQIVYLLLKSQDIGNAVSDRVELWLFEAFFDDHIFLFEDDVV